MDFMYTTNSLIKNLILQHSLAEIFTTKKDIIVYINRFCFPRERKTNNFISYYVDLFYLMYGERERKRERERERERESILLLYLRN